MLLESLLLHPKRTLSLKYKYGSDDFKTVFWMRIIQTVAAIV